MEDTSDLLKQGMQVLFAVYNRSAGMSMADYSARAIFNLPVGLGTALKVIVDDDDVWEAYIEVLFFLISNVARLKGLTISFRTEHAIVWPLITYLGGSLLSIGSDYHVVISISGLPIDVTSGSDFDMGFALTVGHGFILGSSSLAYPSVNDDSNFNS
ncbi:hypothetical protein CFP56_035082 [Quercus suber]|uniref:Uncharacterized protein n=1 Tax=Quercus suber TaxID=58331 RepID=A0AAW0JB26_QUESU